MANQFRNARGPRSDYDEPADLSVGNMTDREYRLYCVGLRLWIGAGIKTPFYIAMDEQGESTVTLAIQSALNERDIEHDTSI